METKIWRLSQASEGTRLEELTEAAAVLRAGGIVAFPTETVYGLGAHAADTAAVERVFAAKGRPLDNPLIVHVASIEAAGRVAETISETERALMEAFWPGPLSLVLRGKVGAVSGRVTCGLPTVAVRMPDHPAALSLLEAAGCPVAAPSANRSGRPSPTSAAHVLEDLDGRIDGIVDDGATGVGLESTVAEVLEGGAVRILRPGGVTREQLEEAGFRVEEAKVSESVEAAETPRSPGMKYAHYAPKGELTLVAGDRERAAAYIHRQLAAHGGGVLTYEERAGLFPEADVVVSLGSLDRLETAAQGLYAALRRFDELGVERIYAEACSEEGIGEAVMNRLRKASGGRSVHV